MTEDTRSVRPVISHYFNMDEQAASQVITDKMATQQILNWVDEILVNHKIYQL